MLNEKNNFFFQLKMDKPILTTGNYTISDALDVLDDLADGIEYLREIFHDLLCSEDDMYDDYDEEEEDKLKEPEKPEKPEEKKEQ